MVDQKEQGATPAQRPQVQNEPKPPFPGQHQEKPGLKAQIRPRPQYEAPLYRPSGKLEGKAALITGGDSGIGRAVAVLYAREGADVAITFLPPERPDAEETRRVVEGEGKWCLLLEGDLTDPAFCRQTVERTASELGKLDILVSNAGYQNRKKSVGGAIHAFTKGLAENLIKKGIRVNAVAPGPVWTPLNIEDQGTNEKKIEKFGGSSTPIGRPAQPEEVAPAYVFLASDPDSSYITGIVLPIMGGHAIAA